MLEIKGILSNFENTPKATGIPTILSSALSDSPDLGVFSNTVSPNQTPGIFIPLRLALLGKSSLHQEHVEHSP